MAAKKVDMRELLELDFSNCVPPCTADKLNKNFVDTILFAQGMCGMQFRITSALRPLDWEISRGRKGTSSHVKGLAIDVSTQDSYTRFKVVAGAILAGIPRIGIGKTFVHLDCDASKPHPIIFHYYDPQNT